MIFISKTKETIFNIVNSPLKWLFILIFFFGFQIDQKIANAGLLSFFNTAISGEQVSAKNTQKYSYNSQNIALLEASVNSDPNPDNISENVPLSGKETLVADIASSNNVDGEYSNQISVYEVREGDTISGIAKMFNVSVNTILWANDLNSRSVLKKGQSLIILPVSGLNYKIQKGDTIISIAKKYKADVDEIYRYNDMDESSKLSIGQMIIIPNVDLLVPSKTYVAVSLNGVKIPYDPLIVNVKTLPYYSNYYSCPVSGRLSQSLHGRNSVDLAAPNGSQVRASASGIVTISKADGSWHGGYGNYVVLSHDNNTQTLYAHMLSSVVKAGERVSKGQVIGYVGVSGLTTGPHLHFEIRGAQNPFSAEKCI